MVSLKKHPREGKPSAQTKSHITMDKPPVPSASPGQEKSKHCESKAPVVALGDVTRNMVTRSNKRLVEGNMGNDTNHDQHLVPDLPILNECEVKIIDCRSDVPKSSDQTSSSSSCDHCGKLFKGAKGVKIHQSKTLCGKGEKSHSVTCSLDSSDGNSGPLASQESIHGAMPRHLQNEIARLNTIVSKPSLLWPRMSDSENWTKLENRVKGQLSSHLASVDHLINNLEIIVYEEAKQLFGVKENKKRAGVSRREGEIAKCRANIRNLKKTYKRVGSDEERSALAALVSEYRDKLSKLRRAENSRKRRWRRKNTRSRFFKDPFGVAREVLTPKVLSQPTVSHSVLDHHLKSLSRDDRRDVPLGELPGLPEFPRALTTFDEKPLQYRFLGMVVKKKRNASRPGVNGIPYKVYKKCPYILNALFRIMERVKQSGKVPLKWRIAEGIFIPKVDKPNSDSLGDYRQIALGNVEGKLFWSLVADRFYKYLVADNSIINTSCQKGSVQKMSGVWEHTSMVWSALKDCKSRKKSIAILWLDLANAYGSVPHKLIEFAL